MLDNCVLLGKCSVDLGSLLTEEGMKVVDNDWHLSQPPQGGSVLGKSL